METPNYDENLPRFLNALRDSFNPEMQFVMSQVPSSFDMFQYPGRDVIRSVQQSVATSDPFVSLIEYDGLEFYPGDPIHLNAAGQIGAGQRYAAAYIEAVPEPSTALLGAIVLLCFLPMLRTGPFVPLLVKRTSLIFVLCSVAVATGLRAISEPLSL